MVSSRVEGRVRGLQKSSFMVWLLGFWWVVTCCGCDDPAPTQRAVPTWACPEGWVAYERGGCGPAVVLCAPGGGAARGACDGRDVTRPPTVTLADGGTARGLYRLPDGGIGGGWPEVSGPDEMPSWEWLQALPTATWEPDAGIALRSTSWSRRADGTYDPLLRADCPRGSEALPGGGCTPTSERDCPSGAYADLGTEPMGARVVHVGAGADTATADGSGDHPYATLAAGVAAAGDNGWVRVAAGEYREQLELNGSTHVVGVCAARVTIRGSGSAGSSMGTTVLVSGVGVQAHLRGLTVSGTGRGIEVRRGARLTAAKVVVANNVQGGILIRDAATVVDLADCVVRDTAPVSESAPGSGLQVQESGTLRAQRLAVVRNAGAGIAMNGAGSRAEVSASVVRDTLQVGTTPNGGGILVQGGATLSATEVVVSDNVGVGIGALSTNTQASVANAVVRATRPLRTGTQGYGATAGAGAALRITGSLIEENSGAGVQVGRTTLPGATPASVEITGSVVRGRREGSGAQVGGLEASGGATAHVERVIVEGSVGSGVFADGAGTRVTLVESTVRDTRQDASSRFGFGLYAQSGATLVARRALVTASTDTGVVSRFEGSVITLEDSVIRDTRATSGAEESDGVGLAAQRGGVLDAARVLVTANEGGGAIAFTPLMMTNPRSALNLRQSVVRDNGGSGFGFGLWALYDATVNARQVIVSHNPGGGVLAGGAGAQVVVEDSVIREISGNATAGVGAFRGGSLSVVGSLVQSNAWYGVYADEADTHVELIASAVRNTRGSPQHNNFGDGMFVKGGATLQARAVFLENNQELGVAVYETGTRVTLSDVVVNRVTPSSRGFGAGLYATRGGRLEGARVAILSIAGVGVAAVPGPVMGAPSAAVTVDDLFIRDVRASTLQFREDNMTDRPQGQPVAYGLHTGAGCTLDVRRGVIDDGGHGFFNAGGTLGLCQVVVTRQRVAAGVFSTSAPAPLAACPAIFAYGNVSDAITRNADLPVAFALSPPPTICITPPCGRP